MTTAIHSRESISAELKRISTALVDEVSGMNDTQFNQGTDEAWSASGYLKHLIITMKMFGKGLRMPPEVLTERFGQSDAGSKTYEALVALYGGTMQNGWQAPAPLVPTQYRMPDDVRDEKTYLVETWKAVNQRVLDDLATWSEDDLDVFQLPHAAVGNVTLREMLFFTIHHNRTHLQDIIDAGNAAE